MKDTIQKYHLIPLFTLLLVLLFFYFPVLFLGRTLQGPEMARMNLDLKSPPSTETILSGKITPQIFNTEQATAAYQRFPNDILMGKMYRSHEIPLWNSHQGLGIPFAAQYETSAFFPLHIIQNLFSTSTRDWFFILHIWLAGIFTYLFFNANKLNRISAFWGACLYMGSGAFSWFMQLEDYMGVAMMLPLLMLATYLLSDKNSARRIAFLAITTALMLFAGQPEAAFYCFVLSGCYYLFRVYSTEKKSIIRAKHLITFVSATLLGFLLASPLLLLFMELFKHGYSIHSNVIENDSSIAGIKARTPLFLLPAILLPQLLDWPIMPLTLPAASSWDFLGAYVSIIPIFFFFAGCILKHTSLKKDFVFFILFVVAFLMMDLGLWPFNLIGYLPLFRQAWSPRWGGATWSFALITASTYGFYFLQTCSFNKDAWKKLIKQIAILTGLVFYVCMAMAYNGNRLQNAFIFIANAFYQPWTNLFVSSLFFIAALSLITYIVLKYRESGRAWISCVAILIVSLWYCLPKGDLANPFFIHNTSIETNFLITKIISLVLALIFLTAILAYVKQKRREAVLLGFLIFVVSVLYNGLTLPGYPQKEMVEKPTGFIGFLQNNAKYNRFFAFNGIVMPTYASVYGLYDPRSIVAVSYEPYQYFIEKYIQEQKINDIRQWFDANQHININTFNTVTQNQPSEIKNTFAKSMNLTSVKYFISRKNEDLSWLQKNYPSWADQLKMVYTDDHGNIFENKKSLPRVFLVSRFAYADSYETAQAIAMNKKFDLLHNVILEKNLSSISSSSKLIGSAEIEKYTDNKITIKTESNQNALLVLTDIDYPGWQATIDKNPTEIYRADGLVRGVVVPAGNHKIKFYYFPKLFKFGLILMLSALLICIILLCIRKRKISA